jgi:hypothetical protein
MVVESLDAEGTVGRFGSGGVGAFLIYSINVEREQAGATTA